MITCTNSIRPARSPFYADSASRAASSGDSSWEVRIGKFDGITFLNLDADPADPAPKPMDYRISDCFVAGGQISWGIVRTKS